MEVNILMIDDHQIIIEGYKSILSFNDNGYQIHTYSANDLETAYHIITQSNNPLAFDIVFIDVILKPFPEKNIHSGQDLVPFVKKYLPKAKIIMLTSHTESFLLNQLLESCKPNGLIVKSDLSSQEFLEVFEIVMQGKSYYSPMVMNQQIEFAQSSKMLDSYNQQIITLLSRGILTKNLHLHLCLSKSAIEKRKAKIKEFFGIEKGTDEDIIHHARARNMI